MAIVWSLALDTRSFGIPMRVIRRCLSTSTFASPQQPSIAPKAVIDIRHLRQNPELHAQNCIERNCSSQAGFPARIVRLFDQWKNLQERARGLREENNRLHAKISLTENSRSRDGHSHIAGPKNMDMIYRARQLKKELGSIEQEEAGMENEIQELATALPNLTSEETPIGSKPRVLGYINEPASPTSGPGTEPAKSHVQIGQELNLLDFAAAATTSGWGWYFLKNEAALLEQALVQYSLSVAMQQGFAVVSPPSLIYSHISSACGYRPRDQGNEQQVYCIKQDASDAERGRPELSLAGTAEIPLAGMKSNSDIEESELPLRLVGSSRCYRAEAGSRGVDTKGLYRVHEFTKVEMFSWTRADAGKAEELFHSMVAIQSQILRDLGLYCRVMEQPSTDLGASATRKQDIEAMFPSRRGREGGWGEVTSASICTDYQSRRLATRIRGSAGRKYAFPYTVNGTAIAVPRVLAAILETCWDATEECVRIPEVLWPWMHGVTVIQKRR